MAVYDEEIKELEELIKNTPYNKRTQHAIGLYKAKLARLKEAKSARAAKKVNYEGYSVKKSGDGTAILIGFPSVGKSTLLNKITNAESKIAAYAFTTLTVVPGIMEYESAKIQILDVPGILKGAAAGTGRGKEVLAVMRSADLCIFVVEVQHPEHLDILRKEVYEAGIRVDQKKPDVSIIKKPRGGIDIASTVKLTHLSKETIIGILKEFKIHSASVLIKSDITADQLIDVIEANKVYMESIVVLTKIDTVNEDELEHAIEKTNADIAVSAEKNIGVEELKKLIFKKLNLIRIYLKEPKKDADMNVPLIIRKDSSIRDICNKIHRDMEKKFKFARIWGESAKFPGQKVQLKHIVKDKDIVELHLS